MDKKCDDCGLLRPIWKNTGGKKYCKRCWHTHTIVKQPIKKPIPSVSSKLRKLTKLYSEIRLKYLEKHPFCKAVLPGCLRAAEEIHHSAGRGINLINTDTWIPICRECHKKVEMSPILAKELELSQTRLT